jgi:hypothetical protein
VCRLRILKVEDHDVVGGRSVHARNHMSRGILRHHLMARRFMGIFQHPLIH